MIRGYKRESKMKKRPNQVVFYVAYLNDVKYLNYALGGTAASAGAAIGLPIISGRALGLKWTKHVPGISLSSILA